MSDQPAVKPEERRVIEEVLNALRNLRFGSIEITVHDGKATQIERKEKVRF
jgi:hypothetical protein